MNCLNWWRLIRVVVSIRLISSFPNLTSSLRSQTLFLSLSCCRRIKMRRHDSNRWHYRPGAGCKHRCNIFILDCALTDLKVGRALPRLWYLNFNVNPPHLLSSSPHPYFVLIPPPPPALPFSLFPLLSICVLFLASSHSISSFPTSRPLENHRCSFS